MDRLESFENMLAGIEREYADTVGKLEALKKEGKAKSASFRQLLGNKMMLLKIFSYYKAYGLVEDMKFSEGGEETASLEF